jgi:hypothetical protein
VLAEEAHGKPRVNLRDKDALWKTLDLPELMRQHRVTIIYTRDRDFRRYDGIESHDPFG